MRFLFVDRILALNEGVSIQGLKHVTLDDEALDRNASGQYFLTSSLLGETLGQLAAWNVMKTVDFKARPVAGILARAQFTRPAMLGETVFLEAFIDQLDETSVAYHAEARVCDEIILSLEGSIGPMLPMEHFIDESLIRQQFAHIHRPGAWPQGRSELAPLSSSEFKPSMRHVFQFDRLLSSPEAAVWRAEKCINFAAPYFADHFPRHPVLPLTVLLECQQNLARDYLQHTQGKPYRLCEIARVKMKEFVHPGDVIESEVRLKHQQDDALTLQFMTEREGKRLCTAEMTFVPENPL